MGQTRGATEPELSDPPGEPPRLRRRRQAGRLLVALLIANLAGLLLPRAPSPLPLPAGMREVQVGSTLLRYRRSGDGGIAVLLLHGSPGSSGDFDDTIAEIELRRAPGGPGDSAENALSQRMTLYALDMAGFGATDAAPGAGLGVEAQARLLEGFMDELHIGRAHLFGYSWGGGLGIALAAQSPKRVASLTLLDSMGLPEGEPTGSYALERLRSALAFPYLAILPGALLTPLSSPAHRTDFDGRMGFLRSFWETDLRRMPELMRQVASPTLVLHGDRDTVVEPWVAREHAALIPGARLEWYSGGHGTIFWNSEAFLPPYFRFIADNLVFDRVMR